MNQELLSEILHDYRSDLDKDWENGNQDILYKTLKYEQSSHTHVEKTPAVLEA